MDFLLEGVKMDIKLRQAKENDISTLKNLWQICFGDRMRYIDVFFENMFIAKNTVVAEADGNIAGVVYILNRSLNGKRFLYGYGIGVFPEFRGNNICEIMLNHIKMQAEKTDCIFGLHPANDKLAEFYKRIGLNEMYSLKIVDASEFKSNNIYELEDITLSEFYKMRKETFINSVDWDKHALEYILTNGETVKKIALQEKNRYFVLSKIDNSVIVKETTATDSEIEQVSDSIKKHFDVNNIHYILPTYSNLHGIVKPMIYGFSQKDKNVYMNLFLD